MRIIAALVAAALFAAAAFLAFSRNTRPVEPSPARPPASPAETAPAEREASARPRLEIRTDETRADIVRAVRDLRRLGVWDDLTSHLLVVSIGSRPGRQHVPPDGHLAEARIFPYIDEEGNGGPFCDVTFFSTAMDDDLVLQERYHAQGALDDAPPTRRDFWAAILAHELAHCLGPGHDAGTGRALVRLAPERVARAWERRVLRAAQRQRP